MDSHQSYTEPSDVELACNALRMGSSVEYVSQLLGIPSDCLGATLSFEIYRQHRRHVGPSAAIRFVQAGGQTA